MKAEPSLEDIRQAHERIRPFVHRTPVLTSSTINRIAGGEIFFKCENFQKAGAFKIRGACNAVFSLSDDEAKRGMATHSSGNHAAALALAARWRGVPAYVVMPETAPHVKKLAVAGYGAEIVFCKPTLEARERALAEVVARTGAVFVHPYNDLRVITGQGTAAIELCEEVQNLDLVVVPVGGGGLIAGVAAGLRAAGSRATIWGVEPTGAPKLKRSLEAGRRMRLDHTASIADGLITLSIGAVPFAELTEPGRVAGVALVDDASLREAMHFLWRECHLAVEASGAATVAAVRSRAVQVPARAAGSTVLIVSGGNVDPALLED